MSDEIAFYTLDREILFEKRKLLTHNLIITDMTQSKNTTNKFWSKNQTNNQTLKNYYFSCPAIYSCFKLFDLFRVLYFKIRFNVHIIKKKN
jgi:hypothetical protein